MNTKLTWKKTLLTATLITAGAAATAGGDAHNQGKPENHTHAHGKEHAKDTDFSGNPARGATDTSVTDRDVSAMSRDDYTAYSREGLSAWQDRVRHMEAAVDDKDSAKEHTDAIGSRVRKWENYHRELTQADGKDWKESRDKIEQTRSEIEDSSSTSKKSDSDM